MSRGSGQASIGHLRIKSRFGRLKGNIAIRCFRAILPVRQTAAEIFSSRGKLRRLVRLHNGEAKFFAQEM
jgi:hypothetical protein